MNSDPPHFVRDYKKMVEPYSQALGSEQAMQRLAGGNCALTGALEFQFLTRIGLDDVHTIIDVGSGSGRLSTRLGAALPNLQYHGADILPQLVDYAKSKAPKSFKFTVVDGLTIPEADETADFVVFFSVLTHLMLHESFVCLEEAKRVTKPGGRIVISYLDPSSARHWPLFFQTAAASKVGKLEHFNSFIGDRTFQTFAYHLRLELENAYPSGASLLSLDMPTQDDSGEKFEGHEEFGQSIVLRKPKEDEELMIVPPPPTTRGNAAKFEIGHSSR